MELRRIADKDAESREQKKCERFLIRPVPMDCIVTRFGLRIIHVFAQNPGT